MSDLPPLFPVTRSGRKRIMPARIRNSIFFCQEYPDGVYIDKNGTPQPGVAVDMNGTNIELLICSKQDRHLLSKEERIEQRNIREDARCEKDHLHYNDDIDYNKDDNEESSSEDEEYEEEDEESSSEEEDEESSSEEDEEEDEESSSSEEDEDEDEESSLEEEEAEESSSEEDIKKVELTSTDCNVYRRHKRQLDISDNLDMGVMKKCKVE
jgi:flagellar biosynthesis GTPase FlhF